MIAWLNVYRFLRFRSFQPPLHGPLHVIIFIQGPLFVCSAMKD